ncbi:RDD family protein [Gordonia sp. NPDC003376]
MWGRGGSATVGVGRDDLVSGEAVALELPAASLGLRILSGLIDVIVGMLVLALLIYLSFKLAAGVDDALFAACLTMSTVLAWCALPTTVETLTQGKTLGHLATGMRTVRDDAGPIGFRHALTRALIGTVEIYTFLGVPALIGAAINRKNKRIGDMIAGTYVVRDRHSIRIAEPPAMPPALREWARVIDIGSIPDPVAGTIRKFLIHREQYTPQARAAMAERLTHTVAPFVAPPPPMGAPFEEILAAIMAERRNRDTDRISREDRLRERLLR